MPKFLSVFARAMSPAAVSQMGWQRVPAVALVGAVPFNPEGERRAQLRDGTRHAPSPAACRRPKTIVVASVVAGPASHCRRCLLLAAGGRTPPRSPGSGRGAGIGGVAFHGRALRRGDDDRVERLPEEPQVSHEPSLHPVGSAEAFQTLHQRRRFVSSKLASPHMPQRPEIHRMLIGRRRDWGFAVFAGSMEEATALFDASVRPCLTVSTGMDSQVREGRLHCRWAASVARPSLA